MDLELLSCVDVVFSGQKVSLGTPGRSQALVVVFKSAQKCNLDDKRTRSSGENVRCQIVKMDFLVVLSRMSRNHAQRDFYFLSSESR